MDQFVVVQVKDNWDVDPYTRFFAGWSGATPVFDNRVSSTRVLALSDSAHRIAQALEAMEPAGTPPWRVVSLSAVMHGDFTPAAQEPRIPAPDEQFVVCVIDASDEREYYLTGHDNADLSPDLDAAARWDNRTARDVAFAASQQHPGQPWYVVALYDIRYGNGFSQAHVYVQSLADRCRPALPDPEYCPVCHVETTVPGGHTWCQQAREQVRQTFGAGSLLEFRWNWETGLHEALIHPEQAAAGHWFRAASETSRAALEGAVAECARRGYGASATASAASAASAASESE